MVVKTESLTTPPALAPESHLNRCLPVVPSNIQEQARQLGWAGVGIMVALIVPPDEILLLQGKESPKFARGTLGPLGETTKQTKIAEGIVAVEQPLETLFRGIQEELNVSSPSSLRLRMKSNSTWCINPWPRGDAYPGEVYCAISFPVFVSPATADAIAKGILPENEEVMGATRLPIADVLSDNPDIYRQGTQAWLGQLAANKLLCVHPNELTAVEFGDHVFNGSQDVLAT